MGQTPRLHGRVLGSVGLVVDGVEVALRGTQRRLLVALLLAEAPRAVGVDRLAEVLSGGRSSATDPANAVHAHVARLRRLLHADPDVARGWLCSLPDGYALRPDTCDLWEHDRGLAEAQAVAGHDPERALALLDASRRLWAAPWGGLGEHPALVDHVRRAELRHRGLEERWAALTLEAEAGVELADEVAELARAEPTREQRWSLAMRALARAGRQAEALALYDEARRTLAEELGIDPGPQLRATHQAVLRQEPAPVVDGGPAAAVHVTGGDPFVGRLEELDSLDVLAARSRVVTVTGLGGLGKSRLVREWLASRSRPVRTRWADLRGAAPESVATRVATELGLALSEDDPHHALAMVRGALRHAPTLLVLDNADDVAPETAELVAALVADVGDLTVVVTSRQPLGLTEERHLALAALPPAVAGRSLEGTAAALAHERLGAVADESLARAVAEAAGGLPVAIEMIAARVRQDPSHRVARSGVTPASGDPVARAVEEAVLHLSGEAAELFRRCVHLPGGMSREVAGALLPGPRRVDDRGHEAARARVLRELVSGSLLVTSATTRGVRYRALQPVVDARRAWAEPRDEEATMTAVASWLGSCTRDSYFEPVRSDGIRAVVEEWINLDEVMRWLARHDPRGLLQLGMSLSDVWDVTGRGAEGHRWVRQASGALPDLDPVTRARALLAFHTSRGLAYIAAHGDVVREAITLLREAGAEDTDLWAVSHAQLSVVEGWRGDLPAMERALGVVRTAVERAGSPWFGALVDEIDGMACLPRGRAADGVGPCLRAASTFEELGDVDSASNATYFACLLGRFGGLPSAELTRLLDLGRERAATTGMPKAQALVAGEAARFGIDRGHVAHADELAAALALTEEAGNLHHASVGRRDLGLVLLRAGRHAAAGHQLRAALRHLLLLDRAASATALAALSGLRDGALAATLAAAAWALAEQADGMPLSAADLALVRDLAGPRPTSLPDADEAVRLARDALGLHDTVPSSPLRPAASVSQVG